MLGQISIYLVKEIDKFDLKQNKTTYIILNKTA